MSPEKTQNTRNTAGMDDIRDKSPLLYSAARVFDNASLPQHALGCLLGCYRPERKNSWWPAELAGEVSPDGTKRLLGFSPRTRTPPGESWQRVLAGSRIPVMHIRGAASLYVAALAGRAAIFNRSGCNFQTVRTAACLPFVRAGDQVFARRTADPDPGGASIGLVPEPDNRTREACYLLRVKVRSLGYRTDLAIHALEGSQVTDRGDHLVIRTPGNPNYWWGNYLLLRDLEPGSGGGWLARFAAEFPDARHAALGLDETEAGTVDPGELAGMTMERYAVMTATSVRAPPHPNTEAVFRTLAGDADWRQSFELAAAIYPDEPGGAAEFLTARLAAKRALTEAGHGAWFGAFLGGTLVAQLGLITGKSGLARYQSVETHPAARRRGLAGTLVWHAGSTALTGAASTLVMVADPEDAAIRVYRSVGFTVTESQLSFIRRPTG
jgi:ribosomal protein S18 acetylase RimI-like enzyme